MSAGRDSDTPHDAMLRAALRHAPDRDAVPPAAVSRAILAAARRAVQPPPRRGWWAAIGDAWGALARAPAAGAAFASLVLGTLIVLMWQDGPPPERTVAPSMRPAPTESGPMTAAPSAPVASDAAPDAAPAVAPLPNTPTPAATARREQVAPARPAEPAPPAPPRRRGPAAAATDTSTAPPEPAPAAAEIAARQDRAVAAEAEAARAAPADAALGRAAAASPPPAAAARLTQAAPADPLAPVLAAFGASPVDARLADAHREAPTQAAKAVEARGTHAAANVPAWLTALRDAARGRWERVGATPSDGATLRTPSGVPLGRMAVDGDAVVWQAAGRQDGAWRAVLPPELLAHVRAGLAGLPAGAPAEPASRP